jgi:type IV pilus assembly protein PilC
MDDQPIGTQASPPADAKKPKKQPGTGRPKIYGGIPVREKILFCKHLSVMIHAGLPLLDAIEEIKNQTQLKRFRRALEVIVHEVENGQFLSTAMSYYPKIFDELFTSLIRVGEESGKLSENLDYLGIQLERSHALKQKVQGALVYPAIILAGTFAVVGFLTFVTLPQLMPIFKSLKVSLPPTTQFLLDFSSFATKNGAYLVLAFIAFIVLAKLVYSLRPVKAFFHRFILGIPIFGTLAKDSQLARFTQIMGTLLGAGVDVVRALTITASSMGNIIYREELEAIAKNMSKQGESISDYLARKPKLFPTITERMIRIGEKTGKLDDSLIYVAEFYGKEIDNTVRNMTAVIEPVLLIFMGVIVGFVAISVITPMYKLTEGIHR